MKEEHIIEQLNSLKGICPDSGYAAGSKLKLIHGSPQKPGRYFVFSEGLSGSLSISLVIVFFVIVAIGGASNMLRSPLSPAFQGVNEELAVEANQVNDAIEIHLEEVKYLSEIATGTLARVDFENGNRQDSEDEEIDNLLNEAINL